MIVARVAFYCSSFPLDSRLQKRNNGLTLEVCLSSLFFSRCDCRPTFDHFLQPSRDFVTLVSSRIHSVLGSAWHAFQKPLWMPEIEVKAEPMRVAVEALPKQVETALRVTYEGERGWTYADEETAWQELGDRQVMLWTPRIPAMRALRSAKPNVASAEARRLEIWDLHKCLAMDVALQEGDAQQQRHKARPFSQHFSDAQVARTLRVTSSRYRTLDEGQVTPAPRSTLTRLAQFVVNKKEAVTAVAVAVVATVATISMFASGAKAAVVVAKSN